MYYQIYYEIYYTAYFKIYPITKMLNLNDHLNRLLV